jgi:hypothetical protein
VNSVFEYIVEVVYTTENIHRTIVENSVGASKSGLEDGEKFTMSLRS